MIRIIESTTYEDGKQHLEAYCLSTDDKPTDSVATGSIIRTVDTGKTYAFDETISTWTEVNFNGGGGGGGGSSDFSTAELTLTLGNGTTLGLFNSAFIVDDNLQAYVEAEESCVVQAVLYKGNAAVVVLDAGEYTVAVTGGLQYSDDMLTITGDGTITVS